MPFTLGIIIGLLIAGIGGGIAAYVLHKRVVRMQNRAVRAERLAELGTLTGGLAHEIKNPLSTVQLNLQLLQEDLDPGQPMYSRLVARLGTVRRETGRLKDILDDFLRFAGKIEIDKHPTPIDSMLEELVDFFTPQAQASRIDLRLITPPPDLVANIDERLLKQCILNLMINAVQAMTSTGGEIFLGARREGADVIIDVTDTGPGIPKDVQAKIVHAYYSTKSGGTGLGLAVTKRIVEEHHGSIQLTSDVGKGTRFSLCVPADI